METKIEQTFAQKAIKKRVFSKRREKLLCRNYQAYEAYDDHVDSFVLKYKNTESEETSVTRTLHTFAKRMIFKRVRNKQQECVNSYGEYLEGTHVDSPEYEDYPDSYYNDNE